MEATLYSQMEDRKVVDPSLKVALSDAQQLQDSIAEGTEKFFHFAMYVTIYAPNKDLFRKILKKCDLHSCCYECNCKTSDITTRTRVPK